MYVTAIVIIVLLVIAAVLLLRLRVRFELGDNRRLLFVGLGRSGPEFDFAQRVLSIRLMGRRVKTSPMKDGKPAERDLKAPPVDEKKKAKKVRRARSMTEFLGILPAVSGALWDYSVGMLKSVIVEELEAEIEGGFYEPDLTGQLFGYYQAALAAAPAVVGRVSFTPDWSGPSFAGRARVVVALPLYRLMFRTLRLFWQLPLRRLIKLAIGKKRGGQDGKQQRS